MEITGRVVGAGHYREAHLIDAACRQGFHSADRRDYISSLEPVVVGGTWQQVLRIDLQGVIPRSAGGCCAAVNQVGECRVSRYFPADTDVGAAAIERSHTGPDDDAVSERVPAGYAVIEAQLASSVV